MVAEWAEEGVRHLAGEWGMADGPLLLRHRILQIRTHYKIE